jgi:hypothetical protein
MYLVNVRLWPDAGGVVPPRAAELVAVVSRPGDGLEHVSASATGQEGDEGGVVLGLFILAASVEEAEERALGLFERAVDAVEEFGGLRWASEGAAMVDQYYERRL